MYSSWLDLTEQDNVSSCIWILIDGTETSSIVLPMGYQKKLQLLVVSDCNRLIPVSFIIDWDVFVDI